MRCEPRAGTRLTHFVMGLLSALFADLPDFVGIDSERFQEFLMGIGFKAFKLAMPVVHVVVT